MPPSSTPMSSAKGSKRRSDRLGNGREAGLEIDLRAADGSAAERLAIEPHMGTFVLGDLLDELPDRLALEVHLAAALDLADRRAGVGGVEALPGRGAEVELGFHVLEVQGELQNVL